MDSGTDVANGEALVEESYDRVKGELAALAREALTPVNLDVQVAVSTVLGALPEIRRSRGYVIGSRRSCRRSIS
jgi:hypothetical protein